MAGVLGDRIGDERDGGGELDAGLLADLTADNAGCRCQGRSGGRLLLGIAVHRVEHRCIPQIGRDPHIGDRDETQPRILDPQLEHLGHDVLNAVC